MNLYNLTEEMMKIGYEPDDARARVCQDIVLKALSLSPLSQEEYCFDIAFDNEGASLLINSREQMFSEKLRQDLNKTI